MVPVHFSKKPVGDAPGRSTTPLQGFCKRPRGGWPKLDWLDRAPPRGVKGPGGWRGGLERGGVPKSEVFFFAPEKKKILDKNSQIQPKKSKKCMFVANKVTFFKIFRASLHSAKLYFRADCGGGGGPESLDG